MEKERMTERESLAVITEMISRTKDRYMGDGNIMLLWGYLTVAVTVLVWVLLATTGNPVWNLCWFLIPLVGGVASPIMSRKREVKSGVKSYTDKLTSKIWTTVGVTSAVAMLCCLGFALFKGVNCWIVMFLFPITIVPVVEMAQGFIVKENSFVIGGAIGLAIGIFMTCCVAAGEVPLHYMWALPLFIVAFICMMIVPGHIINRKAKQQR